MKDPIEELGNENLYLFAADLQVQLEKNTANRPVLYLLTEARKKARAALSKMVEVDVSETEAMRTFQQEVRLYGDMVVACQDLIRRGREADSLIAESDRSELAEIIGQMSPEERRLHKLETQGDD